MDTLKSLADAGCAVGNPLNMTSYLSSSRPHHSPLPLFHPSYNFNVVLSIHQPRADIFAIFDNLLLMSVGVTSSHTSSQFCTSD